MTLDDCYEAKNQILNTKLEKNIYVPTYLFESEVKSHLESKISTFFVVATPSGFKKKLGFQILDSVAKKTRL